MQAFRASTGAVNELVPPMCTQALGVFPENAAALVSCDDEGVSWLVMASVMVMEMALVMEMPATPRVIRWWGGLRGGTGSD